MSRHCWVIEVPTTRGGWRIFCVFHTRSKSRQWAANQLTPKGARIIKYVPEVEDGS